MCYDTESIRRRMRGMSERDFQRLYPEQYQQCEVHTKACGNHHTHVHTPFVLQNKRDIVCTKCRDFICTLPF